MTTGEIILHIFYQVDDSMPEISKHPQSKLYPREMIKIGILICLKGSWFRAFYRWLKRDYGDWVGQGQLPERTRLQRLLKAHQDWCDQLMAEPSFFTVIDTYPIELLFPIRQEHSPRQVGKKGRDKGRWSVGIKLCQKGTWNKRMCVETVLSMVTLVCDLKRIRHRVADYIQTRLAFVSAMFNVLLDLFHHLHPEVDPFRMSIAEFSL